MSTEVEVKDVQDTTVQPVASDKIVIEGLGEFTPAEIKEFKNGYMRQEDYTRKTQEVAQLKRSVQNVEPVQTSAPQHADVELTNRVERMYVDMQMDKMRGKYNDFNEVEVLGKALELMEDGVSADKIDFEFIHKGLRSNINADREKIRQEILQELAEKTDVSSLMGGSRDVPPVATANTLTAEEDRVRIKMGLTLEEYHKYK